MRGGACVRWAGVIVLTGLAGCSFQAAPPTGQGLCWRMFEGGEQPPRFEIMARDVPNLESCAAQLEGARMMEGAPTAGAYNGHFIFATEDQITSAPAMDAPRIRVFEAEDRRRVQAGLRALIAQREARSSRAG